MANPDPTPPPGAPGTIAARMRRGAKWIVAGRGVVAASQFLSTIIVARLLGPEHFGLVAIATSISFVLDTATKLSLSNALIRQPDLAPGHFDTAFTLNILRALAMVTLLVVLARPIASIYDDARLFEVVLALAGSIAVLGLISPRLALLNRQLLFRQEFLLNLADKVALLAVSVAVAVAFKSYWAVVLGILAGNTARVVASYAIAPYRPRLSLSHMGDLLSFSIWLSLGQTIGALVRRTDHLLVGYFLGNASVGVFAVAARLAKLTTQEATQPVAQSAFPALAQLARRGDLPATARGYQRAQSLLMLVALPMGIVTAVVADPLIMLMLGPDWSQAALIVQWLAAILAFQTLSTMARPLAMGMGDTRSIFWRDIGVMVTRIPLVTAGLVMGGLPGLLMGRAVAGLIATAMDAGLARRQVGLTLAQQVSVNRRSILAGAGLVPVALAVGAAIGPVASDAGRVALIAGQSAAGLSSYVLILWALRRLSGAKGGPEREFMTVIGAISDRLRGRGDAGSAATAGRNRA